MSCLGLVCGAFCFFPPMLAMFLQHEHIRPAIIGLAAGQGLLSRVDLDETEQFYPWEGCDYVVRFLLNPHPARAFAGRMRVLAGRARPAELAFPRVPSLDYSAIAPVTRAIWSKAASGQSSWCLTVAWWSVAGSRSRLEVSRPSTCGQ